MKTNKDKPLEYVAVNCYGWQRADNPAQAIAGLDLTGSSRPANATHAYEPRPANGNFATEKEWDAVFAKHEKLCEDWDEREEQARKSVALWVREKSETISFDDYTPDGNATLLYNSANNQLNAFNAPGSNSVLRPGSVFLVRNHTSEGTPIIEGKATLVRPVGNWQDCRWLVKFHEDEDEEEVERVLDRADFLPFG